MNQSKIYNFLIQNVSALDGVGIKTRKLLKKKKIEKISDLKNAVLQALKCEKPVVINVEVDPDAIYSFRRDSFKHRQS